MKARDNPFRSERIEAIRFRPQGLTWDQILERLERLEYRASVVGPKGSGKTTMLEGLAWKLVDLGSPVRMARAGPTQSSGLGEELSLLFEDLTIGGIVILDEADQLERRAWTEFQRISHSARGLIISGHTQARLPCLIECTTSPELLYEIVCELVGDDARSIQDDIPQLLRKHHGNIRAALRDLYDIWAETRE